MIFKFKGETRMFRTIVAGALRAGAFAIALAGFSAAALAQSSSNVQLGREIVEASGATRAFDGIVPSIMQQTANVFTQQNPDLHKEIIASLKGLTPEFEKRRTEIIDIIARVYATRFTEAELKEIITFYRSPTGKKFVVQLPGILEEGYAKTQDWGGRLSEEIVQKLRADMKKKGHTI
jgi:uncharacterized protein